MGMIHCGNCGAAYDETLRQCPYCGAENLLLSGREYASQVEEIEKKRRFLPHLPDYLVRLWTKRWGKALTVLVVLALVLGAGAAAVHGVAVSVYNSGESGRQEKYTQVLDSYLADGSYEEMNDYLRQHSLYGGVYQEYRDVYLASLSLNYLERCRPYAQAGMIWKSMFGQTLAELTGGILEIDEYLEGNAYLHGGAEAMEEMRGEMTGFLTDELGLTEEDLNALTALYDETSDWDDITARNEAFCEAGAEAALRAGIRLLEEDEEISLDE